MLIRIIALPEREADRAGVLTCEFLVHRPRIRGLLWITASFLLLSTERPPFVDDRPFFDASSTQRRHFVDDRLLSEALSTEWRHLVDKHVSQCQ